MSDASEVSGFCLFDTAIGACALAWAGEAVTGCHLPENNDARTRRRMLQRYPGAAESAPSAAMQAVIARIQGLLDGGSDGLLDIPLRLDGVPEFHRRVYAVTRAIPPGRTLTYGEVAAQLGEPGAARAVGQALGANPFAPIVPCHRVLAAGNAGGGFSANGGVATKLRMLQIERAQLGPEKGLFD